MICFSCNKDIPLLDNKAGRRDECPHCRADVHSCKNCQFYDIKAYNECKETSADRVVEKERANYCDFFQARTGAGGGQSEKDKLMAAAEALFKKK
jgi:hypothetical protein